MNQLIPGTEVVARGLRWEVVFTQPAREQTLYRLRGLDGGMRNQEIDLLAPFEQVDPIARELDPNKASRLHQWRVYHQAFLLEQALGASALLAVQPGRLRIAPYQLVPVMRALRMARPRLMLADSVGLGKTIQAGLVIAELIARRRAHRILIVSPAGCLLEQWHFEMRERFGLRFTKIDKEKLQEIRYSTELGANPFDYVQLGLTSIDFVKQEKVLKDLELSQYDIVVVDEAHHCSKLGTSGDREDTQRRRLAETLARQSDCLLLLTATPHDGYDPHFASLIELLDPSQLDGRGALRDENYQRLVIRRLKKHITDPETNKPLFKDRKVHPVKVTFSDVSHPHFAKFQEALLETIAPMITKAIRRRRYGDVLAFISLLKRSVSTAFACGTTLKKIADRFLELTEKGAIDQEDRKQRLKNLRDYRRRLERFGVISFDEEQDKAELEAEDIATEIFQSSYDDIAEQSKQADREIRREKDRLSQMKETQERLASLVQLAEEAEPEDPKLLGIFSIISDIRKSEPEANVLVYSEFTDSQDALFDYLDKARESGKISGEILRLSGRDDEITRISITKRFREVANLVLISTDATAEGLNLHSRCHHLVHLELPYNPNRLEQRNGRIDRFGQTHDPHVRYLYLDKTFEKRLLIRLIAKYERQRKRLGFVPNTLGNLETDEDPTGLKLLEGFSSPQGSLFPTEERKIRVVAEKPEDYVQMDERASCHSSCVPGTSESYSIAGLCFASGLVVCSSFAKRCQGCGKKAGRKSAELFGASKRHADLARNS